MQQNLCRQYLPGTNGLLRLHILMWLLQREAQEKDSIGSEAIDWKNDWPLVLYEVLRSHLMCRGKRRISIHAVIPAQLTTKQDWDKVRFLLAAMSGTSLNDSINSGNLDLQ